MLICPKCKAEYEDGNKFCSDCNEELIQIPEVSPKVKVNQLYIKFFTKNRNLLIGVLLSLVLFWGVAMVISSFSIAQSLRNPENIHASLNGSVSVSNMDSYNPNSEILIEAEAASLLGYEYDEFHKALLDGRLKDIPYIYLDDHYIFSKRALEEWVYASSNK